MITAIAIDDEPLALEVIRTFCRKTDSIDLKGVFTETSEALQFLQDNQVDLLFLDINMPAISGTDFYKKYIKDQMVIFTTAYSEHAVEGFNLNAVDYLLKPFEYSRFLKSVEKAKEYYAYLNKKDTAGPQHLFVRADYSLVKVPISEILYIEGLDNYIKIHYDNRKTLLVRMSMKGIFEKLPASDFLRVHRSFIIPINKVTSVRNKIIHLDTVEVPIGTNYVEEVMKLIGDK